MPLHLNSDERRVLGVLIEKSFCTPEQYPLTLNALVVGSNQKSCRNPLSHLDEGQVLDAMDGLREKRLASLVRSTGGRTDRYRHLAKDALEIDGREAAVLGELLLRGPQTDGELRQRANRMVAIDGFPQLGEILERLMGREEPFVRRLSPDGQRRGVKYAHTFYPPGKEPALEAARPAEREPAAPAAPVAVRGASSGVEELRRKVEELEQRVSELEDTMRRLLQE